MLCKSSETCTQSDVQRYKKLVKEGNFYQYIEKMLSKKENQEIDRKKIKAAVFQILFTDNRFFGQIDAVSKRIFREAFPTVYRLFAVIKQKDKRNLPILLQRIESHLVLQVVTKRIAKDRPELPLFTIHDSVITTKGNEEYVKEIITSEIEKAVGFAPKLKTEYWSPDNLTLKRNLTLVNRHGKAA